MNEKAWIAASVNKLNEVRSWTGRTHIHKHLFIAQILELAPVPFHFELHHFGPYSFEADHVIAEMEAFGEVEKKYTNPRYGPRYFITDLASGEIGETESQALSEVAEQLRDLDSSDLELIATCLWVEKREGEVIDQAVCERVKDIKPKYSSAQIQSALSQARHIASNLSP
jgi:uncharacterized protein YwgA